jgi:hypothetical protein
MTDSANSMNPRGFPALACASIHTQGSNPATPEQRKAMTFKGKKVKFDWTNEDWAAAFLPSVRLAVVSLEKDEKELEEAIGKVMRDGIVPDLLDGLTNTKEHLEALASMIGTVLNRHLLYWKGLVTISTTRRRTRS